LPNEICTLNITSYTDTYVWEDETWKYFDIGNNHFCPPYPECIEDYVGEQDTSNCGD